MTDIELRKVLVGIRYPRRIFRIRNLIGTILDGLLENTGKKFIKDRDFLRADDSNLNECSIGSIETGRIVRITRDDLIMSEEIFPDGNKKVNKDDFKNFCSQVADIAFPILKVPSIRRLGIIYEFEISIPSKYQNANELIKEKFINFDYPGEPENCQLKFSMKELAANTGIVRNNEDYYNTIFTIFPDKSLFQEKDIILLSVDTQKYNSPPPPASDSRVLIETHFNYTQKRIEDNLMTLLKTKEILSNE